MYLCMLCFILSFEEVVIPHTNKKIKILSTRPSYSMLNVIAVSVILYAKQIVYD